MKGIILAAGFGTRLKPLTNNKPKALVELNGKPLLFYIIEKFVKTGINDIYINTFYFSEQIQDYIISIEKNHVFGTNTKITVIEEKEILGTGGGIKNISEKHLKRDDSFVVYNVDVICNVDLKNVIKYHNENNAFVTMVMQDRKSKNPILTDGNNKILGRAIEKEIDSDKNQNPEYLLAFCGIQIIDNKIQDSYKKYGFFSIIDIYLDLIKIGKNILSYKLDKNIFWKDVGTIQDLKAAEKQIKEIL